MYTEHVFFPKKDTGIPRESREFRGAYGNCQRSGHGATCKPKENSEEIARNEPSIQQSKSRNLREIVKQLAKYSSK